MRGRSLHVVVGLAERAQDHLYNSAVLIGPNGYIGTYRKIHLFFEETLWFTPGNTGFQVWDIGQAKVGLLVCFDWFYPEAARTLALQGADILCHPSNLVLPHCPDAMVTRCLENHVFAITAAGQTNVGFACFAGAIDHAAEDRKRERCFDMLEPGFQCLNCADHIETLARAAGAGNNANTAGAEAERLEHFETDFDFLLGLCGQRYTDCVANSGPKQASHTD